jgi:hypothetical protein
MLALPWRSPKMPLPESSRISVSQANDRHIRICTRLMPFPEREF